MENNEQVYMQEYPYGIFPTNYTKEGQEAIKENKILSERQNVSALSTPSQTPQQPSFDIAKLLPLLKMMNNKKSISQNDMLQLVLPMLMGGNTGDLSEIIKSFSSQPEIEEPEDVVTNQVSISSYKKIEWPLNHSI